MASNTSSPAGSASAPKQPSHRGIIRAAGNLALASIGITGVLVDGVVTLYRRSVERGGSTVQRVHARLPHPHRPHRRSARPAGRRWGRSKRHSEDLEAILARLNVPTSADLTALAQQIGELEAKIDQLANK